MPDYKYQVFLSHSSPDKPAVEELAVRLKKEGLEPWLDKWNLVPGEAWQPALERALVECASCAVFIGPGGFGAWQDEEMRAAIGRRVSDTGQSFRVIPVLLPTAERPDRSKLPTFLVASTWVEFRRSLDDDEAFRRFLCGIRGLEPGIGDGRAPLEGTCPYRGLEAFDVEHAASFFGREALTEWLVNAIRPRGDGHEHRFLAILGASGSGKSSLARAGLIASLRRGALEGSGSWPSAILKPGRDPVESLAIALSGLGGAATSPAAVQQMIAAIKSDEKALHLTARLALRDAPATSRLVLLVDQCEEAFTTCNDDATRRAFFDNLLYAATVADGRTIVVLTMRADFYGKCALHPALAAAMSDNQLLVGPMARDELRAAIERPAALAGGEFEPGLVEVLLQDIDGEPGSLPLLQFALTELWQRREGRRLTVSAYQALGGLQGALKNRADEVFGQLDAAGQEICRRVFLGLTQPGEGSEDTRRRARFDELVPAGSDPKAVEAVINRLADARLIIVEGDLKAGGAVDVEVAHEALIRGWSRLRQWIEADRAGLRLHRQIAEAAREWQAGGRQSGYLLSGPRLSMAIEWARGHADQIDAEEKAFLDAGRRRRLVGRLAIAGAAVLALAAIGAVREWSHRQDEVDFRKQAEAVDVAIEMADHLANESSWRAAIAELQGAHDQLRPDTRYEALRAKVEKLIAAYRDREDEQLARQRDGRLVAELAEAQVRGWGVQGVSLGAQAAGDDSDPEAGEGEPDPQAAGAPFDSRAIVDGFDPATIIDGYRRTFRAYGLDVEQLTPADVVAAIRRKEPPVRRALAAVIDDWAGRVGPPEDARLRGIATEVDPDPWRVAIRQAIARRDVPALRKQARDPAALEQPAGTLLLLGSAMAQAREYAEAVKLLVGAQRRHPADFSINMTLAHAAMRAEPPRYDESTRYYAIAVALKPGSPGANNYMGFASAGLGRFDDAIYYTTRAIQLDPTSGLAYHFRANALNQEHQYNKAIADCTRAIELDPKDTFAYSNRGAARLALRQYQKAIDDFTRELELDPQAAGSLVNRGLAHAALRQDDRAIADYDKAIALRGKGRASDRDVELAYRNRGDAHLRRGAVARAIDDFTDALKLAPDDFHAYFQRGLARNQEHDCRGAVADFEAAIRHKQPFAAADGWLAWLLSTCPDESVRDGRRAVELAKRACELSHWRFPLLVDRLAAAYAETGDFAEAVKYEERALTMKIRHSGPERIRKEFEHRLSLYRAGKPFRMPGRPSRSHLSDRGAGG